MKNPIKNDSNEKIAIWQGIARRSILFIASAIFLFTSGFGNTLDKDPAFAYTYTTPPHTLPTIIAHRAGTTDYPENTLLAIAGTLADKADSLWLSVQLSKDNVPVLYRPADLATLTNASGRVVDKTADELYQLNAAWHFQSRQTDGTLTYPYRAQHVPIPSLRQALRMIPTHIPVILDMKALPAQSLAHEVARVLEQEHAWQRTQLYSTEAAYQQVFRHYPHARLFEAREITRRRLAEVALAHQCWDAPKPGTWAGFEYQRPVQLVETFTLGNGITPIVAQLWTPDSIRCFHSKGKVYLVAFGVNTAHDYHAAACLGFDAVLVDSPKKMKEIKHQIVSSPCRISISPEGTPRQP